MAEKNKSIAKSLNILNEDTQGLKAISAIEFTDGPFESNLLNRITSTHVAIPVSIFILYSFLLILYSIRSFDLGIIINIGTFLGGVTFFTLMEYLVHRFVYHPHETNNLFAKGHRFHHVHPKDESRLALPPWISIVVATIILLFFRLIIGSYAFSFSSGFLCGYAMYLTVHYIVHVYPPPKNYFKRLWINHALHHHKDSENYFGVTTDLWDHIFQTHPSLTREKSKV